MINQLLAGVRIAVAGEAMAAAGAAGMGRDDDSSVTRVYAQLSGARLPQKE